jgi:hypothetical protein
VVDIRRVDVQRVIPESEPSPSDGRYSGPRPPEVLTRAGGPSRSAIEKGDVMTEATWGDDVKNPDIDWRMSAALENVARGGGDLAEVTSLEGAVRAWTELDPQHRGAAILTAESAVRIDGVAMQKFEGDGIAALAERLPGPTIPSAA